MRFVWVDAGADPDYPKAIAHGVDGFYFALGAVTRTQLQVTHAAGYSVGVYMASNCAAYQGMTGPEIAEAVHADVQQLKWSTSVSTPKVQFDLEEHEPAKIAACLERWRELQPRRDTSWTLEPFQGGWMTPDFVQSVLGCRVRVVPQFYMGPSVAEPFDMRPAAGDMVLRDLTRRGFPESLVTGFYDAALVTPSSRWNGFAFTQGRLP